MQSGGESGRFLGVCSKSSESGACWGRYCLLGNPTRGHTDPGAGGRALRKRQRSPKIVGRCAVFASEPLAPSTHPWSILWMMPTGLTALLLPAGTGLGSEADFWGRAQAGESLQGRMQNICFCEGQIARLKAAGNKRSWRHTARVLQPSWVREGMGRDPENPWMDCWELAVLELRGRSSSLHCFHGSARCWEWRKEV